MRFTSAMCSHPRRKRRSRSSDSGTWPPLSFQHQSPALFPGGASPRRVQLAPKLRAAGRRGTPMNWLMGLVVGACGLFMLWGASGSDWLLSFRGVQHVLSAFGRTGARVFYVLLGLVALALAA